MKVFINHKKKGRFPIKQISKRVSAALLAVLMGLSLLPQTVLALDPDQRQAERREGYDVATVSGGHSTYANGGTGGVVGQFGDGSIANSYNYGNVTLGEGLVCNNLGGVIGRDMKKSGSQVENVYCLDSSCANASTSGADERVTAVCGQLLARGQVIPAKGHDYQDGKCTVCGAEDPNYQPEQPDQPTQPENPGVRTGDESYVVLWSAVLLLGGAALVLLPRKKRS